VLALRLAALFYRGRTDAALPAIQPKAQGLKFRVNVDPDWLARNPLTATALRDEILEWERIGIELRVPGLEELDLAADPAVSLSMTDE
jgi:exopolyphosphatase/guanosine-5'-triphosphate,3'-diphosphate pyrophosphatase